MYTCTSTDLASVEYACRARHAQLQKTLLRHARKKEEKEEKKKSEFGHAMFGNENKIVQQPEDGAIRFVATPGPRPS